jgi:hypothetical protein
MDSENEFEFDGKIFISKVSIGCEGCAFDTCEIIIGGCLEAKCHPSERSGGDSVIFVEKHP